MPRLSTSNPSIVFAVALGWSESAECGAQSKRAACGVQGESAGNGVQSAECRAVSAAPGATSAKAYGLPVKDFIRTRFVHQKKKVNGKWFQPIYVEAETLTPPGGQKFTVQKGTQLIDWVVAYPAYGDQHSAEDRHGVRQNTGQGYPVETLARR